MSVTKIKSNLMDSRDAFKPFNYPWAYDAWLKHEQSHWLHTEVPMAEDVKDWKKKLTTEEKHFLTNIFRFFTQGDIDVAGGYVNNYLPYFPQPEVRMMLLGFAAREALHIAAYDEPGPRETIFNGVNGYYGDDLGLNLVMCLALNRGDVYRTAKTWTWQRATQQFIEAMK